MFNINQAIIILQEQKEYFATGATLPLATRMEALKSLRHEIIQQEQSLLDALNTDLGKCPEEAYMSEVGQVLLELKHFLRHLPAWLKECRFPTPLTLMPAKSSTLLEPYGQVAIFAPWNYPVQLSLIPLIAAIAAGNCAVLKPSPTAPASAAALAQLLGKALPKQWACVIEGDDKLAAQLLDQQFDFIFYTGSTRVGHLVMEAAARHLTPICLELGGKSPALVTADANLNVAAKRIAWGKCLNAGQTCVSPDYVLADPAIKDELAQLLIHWMQHFTGPNPVENPQYSRIVNQKSFDRLVGLAQGQTLSMDREKLKMAPKVFHSLDSSHPLMQEEIFGPLLPVLSYADIVPAGQQAHSKAPNIEHALSFLRSQPKPLAFYLFTQGKALEQKILAQLSFGGCCVNTTLLHVSSHIPFGGVGPSGMGRYHGQAGLHLMSNAKAIFRQGPFELPLRFPPYKKGLLALLRRFMT